MRDATLHHLPRKAVNHNKPKLRIILTTVLASCVLGLSCSTAKPPVAEAPPLATSPPAEQPQEIAKLPPPEPHEVQEAVKRVFKESAQVDNSHKPAFVYGDFNGDSSQDLAVVLKPEAAKLADLNEEFPNWILRDLSGSRESRGPRLAVSADESLVAVIHGFGSRGWRDQQATQTFLLKNAAGSNMEVQSAGNVRKANEGRKLPGLRGDVVAEVLDGKSGYLYFGDASYSWYDPKTFTGEPDPRRGHGAAQRMAKKQ